MENLFQSWQSLLELLFYLFRHFDKLLFALFNILLQLIIFFLDINILIYSIIQLFPYMRIICLELFLTLLSFFCYVHYPLFELLAHLGNSVLDFGIWYRTLLLQSMQLWMKDIVLVGLGKYFLDSNHKVIYYSLHNCQQGNSSTNLMENGEFAMGGHKGWRILGMNLHRLKAGVAVGSVEIVER